MGAHQEDSKRDVTMNQIRNNWDNLPEPILINIMKKLNLKDVVTCSEVCMNWNIVCEDQLLWKYLLHRDFQNKKDKRGFIFLALTYCVSFPNTQESTAL